MLKKITMLSIRVKNWQAAVDWYQEKLELRAVGLHEDPFCLMVFPEGETAFALDGTNPTLGASNCIPNVLVDDLPETIASLKARGVEFERDLIADEGYRIAQIRDLEGNLINIYDNG